MSINSKSCRSDAVVRTGIAARLAEIQRRSDNATDGPWWGSMISGHVEVFAGTGSGSDPMLAAELLPGNAEFVVNARTDVPALTNGLESVLDYVGRCEESGITMQPGDIRRLIAAALGGAS